MNFGGDPSAFSSTFSPQNGFDGFMEGMAEGVAEGVSEGMSEGMDDVKRFCKSFRF
jgi:hypothetical protein